MLLSIRTTGRSVRIAATLLLFFVIGSTSHVARQTETTPNAPPDADVRPETGDWTRAQMSEMTLDQKIAQLFSIRAYAFYTSRDDEAYRRLVDFVERFGVGGITFFQGEPLEQATLANELQARSRIPLLISQDMEWGAGMRIEHTTSFPRAMALGAARDPALAYAAGLVTAREARALGTHQVFAPVADVNNNPLNPIINTRSFGERPTLVAELATAFARGVQDGGAVATAKHFPGHGDTVVDSHLDLPVLPFDRDRLRRLELVPFAALVEAGVRSVMTGHLSFPELEPEEHVPATLSPRVVRDLLRDDLGYDGLIVTDGLDMAGVTAHFSTGEAAVRALEAGTDLLLLSEDPYAASAAIRRAVETGRLTEERIDESLERVLHMKEWLGLPEDRTVDIERIRGVVATSEHRALSRTIARRSLTLLRNEDDLLPFTPSERRVLSLTIGADPAAQAAHALHARLDRLAGDEAVTRLHLGADTLTAERVLELLGRHDVAVVSAFVPAAGAVSDDVKRQLRLLQEMMAGGVPLVLVSFGNPYLSMVLEGQPAAYVVAYDASLASVGAVAEALFGLSGFEGRLPVSVPDEYAYGAGITTRQVMVREGLPAEAGLNDETLHRVDSLIHASIADRAFPGASVAIGRRGVLARLQSYGYFTYDKETPVKPSSRFDLASLTKVVATTTAAMKLVDEGRLDLDARVVQYLPEFGRNGKEKVTIRQLLTHTSGLIPYRAFHQNGLTTKEEVLGAILSEELQYEPGTESRYSDFGMITLLLVIESITSRTFDSYVEEEIFEPLGMDDTGYLGVGTPDPSIVPTEYDEHFRDRLVQGEVHDETAWILGGTSGHAGLFSTVEDLARFAFMLTNGGRAYGSQFVSEETLRLFTSPADPELHTRALGWDTPPEEREEDYSAGRLFGPRSFGHTGFTGTSMWIDPDQDLFVILLSNRVYPTRQNLKVKDVRARLADLAVESVLDRSPLAPIPAD